MTNQLLLFEVMDTATEASSAACLNDSTAFSAAIAEFNQWLTEHKKLISALTLNRQLNAMKLNSLFIS